MELTSPKVIKEIMQKSGAEPSKGLGQNFLIDKNVLQKIIESSDIKPGETILEVGPGIGTLTKELAQKAGQVISVEKDKKMIQILGETLKEYKNIKILNDDILSLSLKNLNLGNYKLIANIPYYLTSPLIRKFLEITPEEGGGPSDIILMIQKEVAQRICAKPPKMSLLAVSVQFYADAKIISYVSKNSFWPAPKIDSAIIKITPARIAMRSVAGGPNPELFFKIVKAGFLQPRKQLINNFSVSFGLGRATIEAWLLKNNINPSQRAETLSVEDWKNLAESFDF